MSKPTLPNDEIDKFKKLLDTGLSRGEVAKKLGYSKSMVARYTNGYKPKVSSRELLMKKTDEKYKNLAKMCKTMDAVKVAEVTGEHYKTVTKACRKYPKLCVKAGGALSNDIGFIEDVKKLLRKGYDEYEIISCLHYRYSSMKKTDIQRVRKKLPAPRIGFMGQVV